MNCTNEAGKLLGMNSLEGLEANVASNDSKASSIIPSMDRNE